MGNFQREVSEKFKMSFVTLPSPSDYMQSGHELGLYSPAILIFEITSW